MKFYRVCRTVICHCSANANKVKNTQFAINVVTSFRPRTLIIYPNYLHDNPNSRQFERFLLSIKDSYQTELLSLPGPLMDKKNSVSTLHLVKGFGRLSSYIGEFINSHIPALATIPDQLRWNVNPYLYANVCQLMKAKQYDFIITLSFPLSTTLVGEHLKRRFGIPWIAFFYDPWIDNPQRSHPSAFWRRIDQRLERKVASAADACVFTNRTMSSVWSRKYGAQHTFDLPFCYTKEMMEMEFTTSKKVGERIRLLYAGLSNSKRNLQDLFQAVHQLSREGYTKTKLLDIRVAGRVYEPDREFVQAAGLSGNVSFLGMLSQEQLKQEFNEADLFVVVDAPGPINVHTPSKLMDYFYYRQPILGITPQIGGTADLLRESGHVSVENGDITSLKQYLRQILEDGPDILSYDSGYYKHFSPEIVSTRFTKIVNSVL